jgi:hypothetical protein
MGSSLTMVEMSLLGVNMDFSDFQKPHFNPRKEQVMDAIQSFLDTYYSIATVVLFLLILSVIVCVDWARCMRERDITLERNKKLEVRINQLESRRGRPTYWEYLDSQSTYKIQDKSPCGRYIQLMEVSNDFIGFYTGNTIFVELPPTILPNDDYHTGRTIRIEEDSKGKHHPVFV